MQHIKAYQKVCDPHRMRSQTGFNKAALMWDKVPLLFSPIYLQGSQKHKRNKKERAPKFQ